MCIDLSGRFGSLENCLDYILLLRNRFSEFERLLSSEKCCALLPGRKVENRSELLLGLLVGCINCAQRFD